LIVRALATQPEPQPQDESRATYARRIDKAEASVDWRRPAQEIERQVRAFDPVPGAQTRLGDRALKIWRARVEHGVSAEPGTVCAAGPAGIIVACGGDGLCVTELQRAGGKRLPAGEFLAGCPLAEGAVLGAADG
jgi:methionyl-tRNA formyltransferase